MLAAVAALAGCGGDAPPSFDCGHDGEYVEADGGRWCAYIVIIGGFDCPPELPFRIDFGDAFVCADRDVPPEDVPDAVCRHLGDRCHRDGGMPDDGGGPLTCMEADLELGTHLSGSWTDSRSCTADSDCVAHTFTFECPSGATLSQCASGVHRDSVADFTAAIDATEAAVCPRVPADCRGGASCAPVDPACVDGTCTTRVRAPVTCGATTCNETEICVYPCRCGIMPICEPNPSGEPCAAGTVACTTPDGADGCVFDCSPPAPYCVPIPSACDPGLSCGCFETDPCSIGGSPACTDLGSFGTARELHCLCA